VKSADRQPAAFYLLLLVGAGERFCYDGFRSILSLFLLKRLELAGMLLVAGAGPRFFQDSS
jgi:dipeptide/tripeptide permease